MKFINVRSAKARLSEYLDKSQREGVVVTAHGRPKSVLIGVEGYDMEEVVLMTSPKFWKMIEQRRNQSRTSLDEFEREVTQKPKRRKAG